MEENKIKMETKNCPTEMIVPIATRAIDTAGNIATAAATAYITHKLIEKREK